MAEDTLYERLRKYVKAHPYQVGGGAALLGTAAALAIRKKFTGAGLASAGGAATGTSGSWFPDIPGISADLTEKATDLPFYMAESAIGNALDRQSDIVKGEVARKIGRANARVQRGAVSQVLKLQGTPESKINQRMSEMMSYGPRSRTRLRQTYSKSEAMRVARSIAHEQSIGRHITPAAMQRRFEDAGIYIGDDMAGQLVSQARMSTLLDPMRKF